MQKIILGFIAFCATLGAALGVFLYVSLIPHFTLIGWTMAGVVILGLGCVAVMMVSFTFNKVGIWTARRKQEQLNANLLRWGTEGAAYPMIDGTLMHLSAEHERAKVQPQITLKEIAPPKVDNVTVEELYHNVGMNMDDIAKSLNTSKSTVQGIIAESEEGPRKPGRPRKKKEENVSE